MFFLTSFALSVLITAVPAARSELAQRQGGYYWFGWSEGSINHQCSHGAGGSYSAKWSGKGGFVCGKEWNPGGSRTVKYSGSYNATGPGYLSLYGWTRNSLVKYYIVENYDILAPSEPWTPKGNFTTEEGTYDLYQSTRINKPSIKGARTFQQFWSV